MTDIIWQLIGSLIFIGVVVVFAMLLVCAFDGFEN